MSDLRAHVHVTDDLGDVHVYGPGSDIPEWALVKIDAYCFVDRIHPLAEASFEDEPGVPAKAGPRATVDAWTAYAAANSVDVPEGASRADLIAACTAAGVPTE